MVVVVITEVVEATDVVDADCPSLPSLQDTMNEAAATIDRPRRLNRLGCEIAIFLFTKKG